MKLSGRFMRAFPAVRNSFSLKYEPNIDDIFFEDELNRSKSKDLKLCQTSVGPHRDDLLFSIGDVDIRRFGSQGQQRTSALSLKLSEIELVKRCISDTPILLLDDVLSELDSSRQNYLLNNLCDTYRQLLPVPVWMNLSAIGFCLIRFLKLSVDRFLKVLP